MRNETARSIADGSFHFGSFEPKAWERDFERVKAWFLARGNAWATREEIRRGCGITPGMHGQMMMRCAVRFEKQPRRWRGDCDTWRLAEEELT